MVLLERLAVGGVDLGDPHGTVVAGAEGAADAPAALDEGLVRVGHVERRHALLEAAERHRVVRRHRRADAHALGQPRDLLRADRDADGRVDRVVGVGQAAGERLRARVLALEVVDDELLLAAGARDGEDALARRPQRPGPVSLLQRRGEDEGLDRRAGLALALRRQVERARGVVAAADHRAHLAGLVVDRHEGRRRPAGLARYLLTAWSAASWSLRSSVVFTLSPPSNARRAPNRSTSCWRTHVVKYGALVLTVGGLMSIDAGRAWMRASRYSRSGSRPWSNMSLSTRLRRARAAWGWATGS